GPTARIVHHSPSPSSTVLESHGALRPAESHSIVSPAQPHAAPSLQARIARDFELGASAWTIGVDATAICVVVASVTVERDAQATGPRHTEAMAIFLQQLWVKTRDRLAWADCHEI